MGVYSTGVIWGAYRDYMGLYGLRFFPKTGEGTSLGIPAIRMIVFWGIYWVAPCRETTIYGFAQVHQGA